MYQNVVFIVWISCQWLILNAGAYEVTPAKVEVFYPKGFRVSIPAENGITLFAFHGKVNEEFEGIESGTWNQDILKVRDGRYTYTNKITKLLIGDTLYFWTYVIYEGLGYRQENGEYKVESYINGTMPQPGTPSPPTSTGSCNQKSITIANGQSTCPGAIIFEDNFNTLDTSKWLKERRFYTEPDYDFAFYLSLDRNVFIQNGILNIRPIRTEDQFGEMFVYENYTIDDGCTGKQSTYECRSSRATGFIMQPLISGRLSTINSFTFKYGRIDIRAKLPSDSWIYPQLLLEPITKTTGTTCEGGQMRLALTRGTDNQLYGGILLGPTGDTRNLKLCRSNFNDKWHDDFHVYSIEWTDTEINVLVDDRIYCRIESDGGFSALRINNQPISGSECWNTRMAPFDKEFHLTLGVGVGGNSDFPDDYQWSTTKPWRNDDVRGMIFFWRRMKSNREWPSAAATLQIDYVRVRAI